MAKILIVEDELIVAMELKSRLTDLGYTVCSIVASGEDAINKAVDQMPNIILMDINIKGSFDGVVTAEKINAILDIPIIYITAFTDPKTFQRAKITEPYAYIIKPFEEKELHTAIEIALYKHNMERKLKFSERRLSTILKSIGDAVVATDKDGIITYLNIAAEKLLSVNKEEVLGKYVLDIFIIEDRNTNIIAHKSIDELLQTGDNSNFPNNSTIICNNQTKKIVESTASAIKDYDDNINGIVLIFRDITEKFIAEASLLESEKKYREVVENASEIIFALDVNWKYLHANTATAKVTGYKIDELKNLNFFDLILPEYRRKLSYKLIRQFIIRQKTTNIEFPFRAKDGRVVWFSQNNTIIIENDKIIGFHLIARDITEKKLAEQKLNEVNQYIETVLKNIHTGISVHKTESGEIVYTNTMFEEITGYSVKNAENINSLFTNLFPDTEYRNRTKLKIYRDILSEKKEKLKWTNIKITSQDNSEKYLTVTAIPIKEQGITIISLHDITYRKQYEDKISQLSRAVEQSPVSVIITSLEGKIKYTNPKFLEITGYYFDEIYNKHYSSLESHGNFSSSLQPLWDTILNGEEVKGEYLCRNKNDETFWQLISVSPIRNSEGKIIHVLIMAENINEQKILEDQLKNALEQAEESNRIKNIFLGNMSHELRTPMVGILGFAQILKDELEDPRNIEMVDLLVKSGKRLLNTLESILDFSQLESKQLEIKLNKLSLREEAIFLAKHFEDQLKEKNLSLQIKHNDNGALIFADEKLFQQILKNIMNNAIKFTYSGGISIETDKTFKNRSTWGIIKITDSGIGISKEKQQLIFEDFRQVSEGRSRSFEGSGLGLTLAKRLVEKMNGFISVESEVGVGSIFSVHLPAVDLHSKKTDKPPEKIIKNNSSILPEILLVEDNPMNKEVTTIYLKKVCKVEYACDSQTALELVRKKKFPLILMDINLGGAVNGVDLRKMIKKIDGYEKVPMVALTGYAMKGDKEKLLEEGFTRYLSKPFLKTDLITLVEELIYSKPAEDIEEELNRNKISKFEN